MKIRILGVLMVVAALAYSVSIYAFSTASVTSQGTVSITTSDQLLYVYAPGTADNPAGMASVNGTTGVLTLNLGSNGSADKGIQADSTYTYDNVIRVRNNNASAKNIDVALAGVPTNVSVEFGIAAYAAGTCGAVVYAANPAAVAAAAGSEVCVSFKLVATSAATGTEDLDFTITAQ